MTGTPSGAKNSVDESIDFCLIVGLIAFVRRKAAEQHAGQRIELPGKPQLRQVAVEPIHALAHILQEQNAIRRFRFRTACRACR